jgi:hypothetical protein
MASTFRRRPVIAETRVLSQEILYEIWGGECGTGTGFTLITSVFPCHCNSSIAPYSYSCARDFYQKDEREKFGKLSQSKAVS